MERLRARRAGGCVEQAPDQPERKEREGEGENQPVRRRGLHAKKSGGGRRRRRRGERKRRRASLGGEGGEYCWSTGGHHERAATTVGPASSRAGGGGQRAGHMATAHQMIGFVPGHWPPPPDEDATQREAVAISRDGRRQTRHQAPVSVHLGPVHGAFAALLSFISMRLAFDGLPHAPITVWADSVCSPASRSRAQHHKREVSSHLVSSVRPRRRAWDDAHIPQ